MHGKSKTKLGIGVVGCGNISMTYLRNAALFGGVELRACADISADMAALRAQGIRHPRAQRRCAAGRSGDRPCPQPDHSGGAFRHFVVGAFGGQARLHRKAAGDLGRRRPPPGRRGGAARAAARLGARHLPRRRRTAGAPADGRGRDRPAGDRHRLHDGARHGALASQSAILLSARRRPGLRHGSLLPDHAGQSARPGRARHGDGDARPGGAADHRRRSVQEHHASRSARRPTSCRCSNSAPAPPSPSAPPGTSSGTPTTRSNCTARKARCACPIPTRSAAPSRCRSAAPTGRISPARANSTARATGPIAAPDRANYRMLGVADLVAGAGDRQKAARVRRPRAACAGDHGGDPALRARAASSVAVDGTVDQPPLLGEDEAASLLA